MKSIGHGGAIGVDLGDEFSYACVLDSEGEVRGRFRVRTTREAFRGRFSRMPSSLVIVETGTHSPWVSRLLRECGHEVLVANARRVALISESDKKTDRQDCELLARIGRVDPALLSPVSHRGLEAQQDLAVLRARAAAVRARTQLVNSVRGLVKSVGERLPKCSTATFHKAVRGAIPEGLKSATVPLLDLIERLTAEIKSFEKKLEALCKRHKPTALLQAVPGVGPICSLAFVLTIEDPHRFQRSRQVGAYLGLVPKLDQSGGSSPQLRITKAGDVNLRSLLVTSAHYILGPRGPDSDLRRWGLALAERGAKNAKKRAVVAVARRLAVLLHHLWRTGEVYDPLFVARQRGEADDPTKVRPPLITRKKRQPEAVEVLA